MILNLLTGLNGESKCFNDRQKTVNKWQSYQSYSGKIIASVCRCYPPVDLGSLCVSIKKRLVALIKALVEMYVGHTTILSQGEGRVLIFLLRTRNRYILLRVPCACIPTRIHLAYAIHKTHTNEHKLIYYICNISPVLHVIKITFFCDMHLYCDVKFA